MDTYPRGTQENLSRSPSDPARCFVKLQVSSDPRESGADAESAFRILELADAAVILRTRTPEIFTHSHIHAYTLARARVERWTSFSQDAASAPACRVLQPAGLLLPADSYYLFCTAYLLHGRVYTSSPIYSSPPSLAPHSPPSIYLRLSRRFRRRALLLPVVATSRRAPCDPEAATRPSDPGRYQPPQTPAVDARLYLCASFYCALSYRTYIYRRPNLRLARADSPSVDFIPSLSRSGSCFYFRTGERNRLARIPRAR